MYSCNDSWTTPADLAEMFSHASEISPCDCMLSQSALKAVSQRFPLALAAKISFVSFERALNIMNKSYSHLCRIGFVSSFKYFGSKLFRLLSFGVCIYWVTLWIKIFWYFENHGLNIWVQLSKTSFRFLFQILSRTETIQANFVRYIRRITSSFTWLTPPPLRDKNCHNIKMP